MSLNITELKNEDYDQYFTCHAGEVAAYIKIQRPSMPFYIWFLNVSYWEECKSRTEKKGKNIVVETMKYSCSISAFEILNIEVRNRMKWRHYGYVLESKPHSLLWNVFWYAQNFSHRKFYVYQNSSCTCIALKVLKYFSYFSFSLLQFYHIEYNKTTKPMQG